MHFQTKLTHFQSLETEFRSSKFIHFQGPEYKLIQFQTKLIHLLDWKICQAAKSSKIIVFLSPFLQKSSRIIAFLCYNSGFASLVTIRRTKTKYHNLALDITPLARVCDGIARCAFRDHHNVVQKGQWRNNCKQAVTTTLCI